jgi:histone H3/H4
LIFDVRLAVSDGLKGGDMSQPIHTIGNPPVTENEVRSNPDFSERAAATFECKVAQFSKDLAREASEVASRNNSDIVSASDVEHAHQQLMRQKMLRRYRHIGNVAGIVLGAGLSNAFGLANSPQSPAAMYLLTIAICVAAAFTIALHIAKD